MINTEINESQTRQITPTVGKPKPRARPYVPTIDRTKIGRMLQDRERKRDNVQAKEPEHQLSPEDLEKVTTHAGHPGYDPRFQLAPGQRAPSVFSAIPLGGTLKRD